MASYTPVSDDVCSSFVFVWIFTAQVLHTHFVGMLLSMDPLTPGACTNGVRDRDPVVSASGSFTPFAEHEGRRDPEAHLLLLSGSRAFWIDPMDGSTRDALGGFQPTSSTSLIGAVPMDDRRIALLDGGVGSWVIIPSLLAGSSPRERRQALALRGARDAVRFGDVIYVPMSGGTLHVVSLHNLRVLRSYPQLLPAEPSALAVGTSSMYVLLRERAHAFASMAGCGVVHLDRHARRSVSRHSLFRSDCPSSLAMYEDDEALMVDNNGEHPHVRRVGLRLRVSDVANASDRVLWRCSRPGCYLYGLATGASAATALILSGGHGGDGSGRSGDQSSNAEAVLTTVDLKSGRKFNQVRINLPFPAAGEGPGGYLQKGSRLLAPSYLMTRSFTPLPLSEKADPRRATRGLSLIGAVDIEAMRAAVLSHWDELWGGASKTHAYNFLFPGLNSLAHLFRNLSNAKLLFSGEMATLGSRIAKFDKSSQRGDLLRTSASTQNGTVCMVFPAWRMLRPIVHPILEEVLCRRLGMGCSPAELAARVWRVQLNRMPAGSEILPHRDVGAYAQLAHRIHIPLIVPRCVRFDQEQLRPQQQQRLQQSSPPPWSRVPMRESLAFEIVRPPSSWNAQALPFPCSAG